MSADSHGVIAAWDVFPVSRRLCKVQGHTDSVQVSPDTTAVSSLACIPEGGSIANCARELGRRGCVAKR